MYCTCFALQLIVSSEMDIVNYGIPCKVRVRLTVEPFISCRMQAHPELSHLEHVIRLALRTRLRGVTFWFMVMARVVRASVGLAHVHIQGQGSSHERAR